MECWRAPRFWGAGSWKEKLRALDLVVAGVMRQSAKGGGFARPRRHGAITATGFKKRIEVKTARRPRSITQRGHGN